MRIMQRGQVTIPKKLRDRYGITPATDLEFIPRPEGILLVKRLGGRSPFREMFGILNNESNTDEYIEAVRGR